MTSTKKCVKQQTKLANINSIDELRIIRLERKSSPGFAEFLYPENNGRNSSS